MKTPVLLCLALALFACAASPASAEVTDRHREVALGVFDRLIEATPKPDNWEVWPPELTVANVDEINAYATHKSEERGLVPKIVINRGLIEQVANFDPDVLAFTIGHEIGHLIHKHVAKHQDRISKFGEVGAATALVAVGREEELEADLFGMQIALKAGYSHAGIQKNLMAMMSPEVGAPYCAFEGLEVDHPSWEARAAYLQQDEVQRQLWQSMVAFSNGVLFLENESYFYAEVCFQRVTEEFPDCYEAWANLGYARLMQYCDALDENDLRSFDIGHLVVGGFYRRPDSLAPPMRRIDEKLWFNAVGAFREALRLNERLGLDDDMLLVKANLAVAYLVHPNGKQVGEAEKYFSEVFQILSDPNNAPDLDPLVRASILINSGAGRGLEAPQVQQALAQLQAAERKGADKQQVETLEAALGYTQARRHLQSNDAGQQKSALESLESYLAVMSPASSWWPLAYAEYKRLANQLGETPKAPDAFRTVGIADWRPVSSVTLADGVLVGLSQPADQILESLGQADAVVPIIDGTNLKRYRYEGHGISVLASREILAVFLNSENAPALTLRRPGLGGAEEEIRVGMKRAKLESLIGGEWDVQFASIDDPDSVYHLYRNVGLAIRFADNAVQEIVVVVSPRKA
ncbi:M48 family metallopeptidase [Pirellulales bacterium]|nr:M48 family metallopeptidase [Pirellulales bacterium]